MTRGVTRPHPKLYVVRPAEPEPAAALSIEEELHAAIQAEAPNWQRRIFDEYHALVFRLLVKSLGPQSDIEDFVSDVFVSLFESARGIRVPSALRSYVVSITMNIVRREAQRRKRRALLYKFGFSSGEVEDRPGLDDPKAKAALLELSRILDELNGEARAAFVLHSLEDMPLDEIARVLGVSYSTAKRRVRDAHEHLRKRVARNALLADYIGVTTEKRRDES